ncbi:hypothetical protein [Jiella pelagia]|uniref:Uncharacterized protein n=1 Tax=Jiella pelagia TaxID=2986949 RepID=A0ABY7BZB0_9HYPH|nr:hypothetical protein [Jiella pelagia]WAP69108.1 hypothetical protein OH818_01900 [Jiella pelagia]
MIRQLEHRRPGDLADESRLRPHVGVDEANAVSEFGFEFELALELLEQSGRIRESPFSQRVTWRMGTIVERWRFSAVLRGRTALTRAIAFAASYGTKSGFGDSSSSVMCVWPPFSRDRESYVTKRTAATCGYRRSAYSADQ